ncbi:hypothetical protein WISP_142413 [Willisornis vidua]|uniref:Uncharacterized protein n=1 Tax=Willisornis vidua TaxID=1566151 RepID=A0ABQ9CPD6_9PASS|nr:hypothetical protein WISP_142413 [Willisornis vidua]
MSSCPIAGCPGKETDPHLATTSFQVVVKNDKDFPGPPFLQAEQPQVSQPLFVELVFQTLHQPRCPSLDLLQHLNNLPKFRGPELDTATEVWPHQFQVQRKNHFPGPAGHTIPDTDQDATGHLGHLGTLQAHGQSGVNPNPQVPFCLAALQPLCPQPVRLHGVVVIKVQDPALGLVKPQPAGFGPPLQPLQVPPQSPPTIQQIETPPQLGVICKFANDTLYPLVQIIRKDIKQDTDPMQNTTASWMQHRSPPLSGPSHPASSYPSGECTMGCQLLQEFMGMTLRQGVMRLTGAHICFLRRGAQSTLNVI